MNIKTAVFGASGRMGLSNIISLTENNEKEKNGRYNFQITGCIDQKESNHYGQDAGTAAGIKPLGVMIHDNIETAIKNADILIDFSAPKATLSYLDQAVRNKVALVIGTTGFTPEETEIIRQAGKSIPIVHAGNFSTGINTILGLAAMAAKALKDNFNTEIVEYHHKRKKDAPSGTAKMLADAVYNSIGKDYRQYAKYGREGITGERTEDEIGIFAVRAGGTIGRHTIHFASEDETIELQHTAHNRKAFTSGVIKAAAWIMNQSPGYYDMLNVLELT